MDYEILSQKAFEAKKNSYSPYSQFKVGACVLTESGKMFTGCNIENAAYGPSICAERVALTKAISEVGVKDKIVAIAIITDSNTFSFPCGVCRQVMDEFNKDMDIIICKSVNEFKIYKLSEILPHSFSADDLN